jgi:hypothetical protein
MALSYNFVYLRILNWSKGKRELTIVLFVILQALSGGKRRTGTQHGRKEAGRKVRVAVGKKINKQVSDHETSQMQLFPSALLAVR